MTLFPPTIIIGQCYPQREGAAFVLFKDWSEGNCNVSFLLRLNAEPEEAVRLKFCVYSPTDCVSSHYHSF